MQLIKTCFFFVLLFFLIVQGSEYDKKEAVNTLLANPAIISFTFSSWSVTADQQNTLRLSATAGQPLTGSSVQGKYALYTGFWHAPRPDLTAINDFATGLPDQFSLKQNYPNPFNPQTIIEYTLPEASEVKIAVFNSIGQQIDVLISAKQNAGAYKITWQGQNKNGHKMASGLYFYKIQAKTNDGRIFNDSQRMLLIK